MMDGSDRTIDSRLRRQMIVSACCSIALYHFRGRLSIVFLCYRSWARTTLEKNEGHTFAGLISYARRTVGKKCSPTVKSLTVSVAKRTAFPLIDDTRWRLSAFSSPRCHVLRKLLFNDVTERRPPTAQREECAAQSWFNESVKCDSA